MRYLVEAHGGTVHAESAGRGKGSTFTVSLPLMKKSRRASPRRRKRAAGSEKVAGNVKGVRILVVEDDPGTREALTEMLSLSGAEVRSAESAATAMDLFEQFTPELLVCDIAMPDEDGYSLLASDPRTGSGAWWRRARARAHRARPEHEDRRRAFEAGFQVHMAKPVDTDRLVAVLTRLLKPRAAWRATPCRGCESALVLPSRFQFRAIQRLESDVPMCRTAAIVIFLVATCATPLPAAAQAINCDTTGKVLNTRDVMDRFYLWYDRMPAVDAARFDSPEAYLEAVRYRPIDNSFSWITSRESFEALFRSSQSVGIGISTTVQGGEMRVLQVFPGSAGADAGLSRGDRIVEINRQAVATLIASGSDRFGVRRQRRGRRGGHRLHHDRRDAPDGAHSQGAVHRFPPCRIRESIQPAENVWATSSSATSSSLPSKRSMRRLRRSHPNRSTISSSTFAITAEGSSTWRSTWPATSAVFGRKGRSSASTSTTTSKPRSTGFSASRKSLRWRRSTG